MRRSGATAQQRESRALHGRILEQLGLVEDAISAYRRVKPGANADGIDSSGTLARRRLAKLAPSKRRR